MHPIDPTSRRLARREIAVFLVGVAALTVGANASAAGLGADMRHLDEAGPLAQILVFGCAFAPVLAAVAARRLTGQPRSGAGWGWRAASWSELRRAWLAPLLFVGAAALAVWGTGAGRLDPGELSRVAGGSLPDALGATLVAVLALTAGVVPFTLLALGEELAWRGSLATRLSTLVSPFRAASITGVAWSLYHWPLMLFVPGAVDGAPTAWAVACFTVTTTATAFPLHRLWQRTGSIWPAAVFHAASNAAIYFVADPLTADRGSTAWFAGETGVALSVAAVAASLVLWRRWAPDSATMPAAASVGHGEAVDVDPVRDGTRRPGTREAEPLTERDPQPA